MKNFKILLFTSLPLLLLGGCHLAVNLAFANLFAGPDYNHLDLIDNYNQKSSEIFAARDYLNQTLPSEANLTIEFEGMRVVRLHLGIAGQFDYSWKSDLTDLKIDSLLQQIGWTQKELTSLSNKLAAANCVSIDSGTNTRIGWQRSGLGMFFYYLLDEPIIENAHQYNDSCQYIRYLPNVILEYGGGAIGPQCFPGYGRIR